MKWIGQHIYDLVSRFRDDVYLEDISTSTETDMLVVDSDGKVTKRAIDAITVDVSDFMTNGYDNRIITATGTDAMNAEANLTFNGTTLSCQGNATISQASGNTSLLISDGDNDQIALDIQANNTVADVLNITANYVTTANVIDISCDALTTGSALKIEDDSSATGLGGARNIVDIYQKNTAATVAIPLSVRSDGGQTGVLIDKNASGVVGQNVSALHIDLDRTVAGSGTAAHNDVGINIDVNSRSLGTSTLKGMEIDVVGATSGTSTAYGIDITMSGADYHEGIRVEGPNAGFVHKNPTTSSATEGGRIVLTSNDGAALGDDHRLGVLQFAAHDGSDTITGASIAAYADAGWSTTVNDTRLAFYTMDGDNNAELSLTLDSDLLATFAGAITDDDAGPTLVLEKLRDDDAVAQGQNLGEIWFRGQDAGQNTEDYAYIIGEIDVSTTNQESGQLTLGVANHDGGNGAGLILTGGSEDNEIDVTLGLGAASVTTVSGSLTMGSTAALTNAGLVAVANQSNITGLGTVSSGVWNGTAIGGNYIAATQPNIDSIGTDGDTLNILGDTLTMQNATTLKPEIRLQNTTNDATGPEIEFWNIRTDSSIQAGEDNDVLGTIWFKGYNDGTPAIKTFSRIYSDIHDATTGEESGRLTFQVANHDGEIGSGLTLTGGSENAEVDVRVGLGANSLTTVAGDLTVISDLTVTGDTVTFQSANADDPTVIIKNTNDDGNAMARFQMIHERASTFAVGDNVAEIEFIGEDASNNTQQYGKILCETDVVTHGQESGIMKFGVANHDGGVGYGLKLTGGSVDDEVDVEVGLGTASVTTVAGNLDVTGSIIGGDRMHYQATGYASNESNYCISKAMTTNTAPFVHDVDIGSDGLTAQAVTTWMRNGGHVMPNACTLKRWTGWTASQGSATQYVALFRVRLADGSDTDPSAVLLKEVEYTASGNQTADAFNVTGGEVTLNAGDIIFSAMKGAGTAIYLNSTFEVEF